MGILINNTYANKTEQKIIEIYNDIIDYINNHNINTQENNKSIIFPLKHIKKVKSNNIYTDSSFENQTLFMIRRNVKQEMLCYDTPIKYKSFYDFYYKKNDHSILNSILITSLNKDNLIDAKILIEYTYCAEYAYKYTLNYNLLNTSIYKNNETIYNELIFGDNKEKIKEQEEEEIKYYQSCLSKIFNTEISIESNGYLINKNLKILVKRNIFDKVLVGFVINDITNKRSFISVRAFDIKINMNKMIHTIISDSLNYLKSLKKGQFNAGETLLKIQACISKLQYN